MPALEGLDDAQQVRDLAGQRIAVAQRLAPGVGRALAHVAQQAGVIALHLRVLRQAVLALTLGVGALRAKLLLGRAQGLGVVGHPGLGGQEVGCGRPGTPDAKPGENAGEDDADGEPEEDIQHAVPGNGGAGLRATSRDPSGSSLRTN